MVSGPTSVSSVSTSSKVSQPPVTGTVAVPCRVPVGDPLRTSRVPPLPPEEMRAVNLSAPERLYGLKEIQSPLWMSPTVLPPWAVDLFCGATPSESP